MPSIDREIANNQKLKPCCRDANNRIQLSKREVSGEVGGEPSTATAYVEQCLECRSKHHILDVPPVKVMVAGSAL
jgi:hypothetical protein